MSDTPRIDHAAQHAGSIAELAETLRPLERECARMRAELNRATGTLDLDFTANSRPTAAAVPEQATPGTLVCPTCRSDRWAEIYPSKSDPTGHTLYCRRCEEGCVSPLKL